MDWAKKLGLSSASRLFRRPALNAATGLPLVVSPAPAHQVLPPTWPQLVRPDAPLPELSADPSADELADALRRVKDHYGAATYLVYNSSLATTAAPVKQPTGTAIRTMMLLKLGATFSARLIEWGCSFDGFAAAAPGQVELFQTSVAATMSTAYVNADVQPFGNANAPANASNQPVDVTGTSTAGFATAAVTEGTVANYRGFDLQLLPPTAPYVKQWPLGREPDWTAGNFVRCRMTFGTTVNAYIYLIFEC